MKVNYAFDFRNNLTLQPAYDNDSYAETTYMYIGNIFCLVAYLIYIGLGDNILKQAGISQLH